MARRPNKDINTPSLQELIATQLVGQPEAKPVDFVASGVNGLNLQDTILKRKQAQEDRVKEIQAKIQAELDKKAYQRKASAANPNIANEINFVPKESAESILKANLNSQSDEAKLARAQLRDQGPDRVKQLFQVGDKVMGVTYGGKVQPIEVPGGQALNPLNKTLPAEAAEKTGTFQAMDDLIQRIKADVVDTKTGQLSEEGKKYIGPFDAPAQIAKAYTPAADPVAANFHQKLQDLKNQIIYLRSGKQINEEEYKRLRASLPSEYRDDSIFLTNLENFEKTFHDVMAQRQQALSQAGYKVPGTDVASPAAGVTAPKKSGFRVISVRPSGGK